MAELRPDPETLTDGYHTMAELYRQRALYHAAWLAAELSMIYADISAVRSRRHADGEECFGGDYFIVCVKLPLVADADMPHGFRRISTQNMYVNQHYPMSEWDLFADVEEVALAPEWDGHTPAQGNARLAAYITGEI